MQTGSGENIDTAPNAFEFGPGSANLSTSERDPVVAFGDLKVHTEAGTVAIGPGRITLTGTELEILRALLARPSAVIRREDLLTLVRAHTRHATSRSLDGHISRLRKKLGPYGAWIRTFNGVGYRFFPKTDP